MRCEVASDRPQVRLPQRHSVSGVVGAACFHQLNGALRRDFLLLQKFVASAGSQIASIERSVFSEKQIAHGCTFQVCYTLVAGLRDIVGQSAKAVAGTRTFDPS